MRLRQRLSWKRNLVVTSGWLGLNGHAGCRCLMGPGAALARGVEPATGMGVVDFRPTSKGSSRSLQSNITSTTACKLAAAAGDGRGKWAVCQEVPFGAYALLAPRDFAAD